MGSVVSDSEVLTRRGHPLNWRAVSDTGRKGSRASVRAIFLSLYPEPEDIMSRTRTIVSLSLLAVAPLAAQEQLGTASNTSSFRFGCGRLHRDR